MPLDPPTFEAVAASNPLVARIRRLARQRRFRLSEGLCLVEGPKLVAEALDAGAHATVVVRDGEVPADIGALEVARRVTAGGGRAVELPPGVLAGVVDAVSPQPLAALVVRRPCEPDELLASLTGEGATPGPILVLAGVSDPGNVGTLLRSAEAAGARAVVCAVGGADPFQPKVVRAAAGSLFRVPVIESWTAEEAVGALTRAGLTCFGTEARRGAPMDETPLAGSPVLVLGNEAHGLGPEVADAIDRWLTIPMAGRVESLNVAMAGTLVLFEAARQRRAAPPSSSSARTPEVIGRGPTGRQGSPR